MRNCSGKQTKMSKARKAKALVCPLSYIWNCCEATVGNHKERQYHLVKDFPDSHYCTHRFELCHTLWKGTRWLGHLGFSQASYAPKTHYRAGTAMYTLKQSWSKWFQCLHKISDLDVAKLSERKAVSRAPIYDAAHRKCDLSFSNQELNRLNFFCTIAQNSGWWRLCLEFGDYDKL